MPDMSKKAAAPAKGVQHPKVVVPDAERCDAIVKRTGIRCQKRRIGDTTRCQLHSARKEAEGPKNRCTAWARTANDGKGERCRQPAYPGASVCKFHGGAAKQVKQAAALRLASLVSPAIGTLAREMVKAERSADRQRAANSILDRAGIVRQSSSDADTARQLLIERLRALREQAAAGEMPPELEVLDAEVVDEGA